MLKRISLPCELVRFKENHLAKEEKKRNEKSCMWQNFSFKIAPKPNAEMHKMQEEFVKWLEMQDIIVIADL